MTEKTKDAILNSILHHERMQKWVKIQNKNDMPEEHLMRAGINENWYSRYCDLCLLFKCECGECPLGIKFGRCGNVISKNKNAWNSLALSITWKQWLKWDKKLVKQLKSLLRDYK